MSQAASSESQAPSPAGRSRRRGPPLWGIVVFLALLGVLVVVNQLASTGGAPIQWTENDLEAALKLAAQRKQRVFLYLYEPDDPVHVRNERQVFTQRWAHEPLKHAVSCRIALKKGDLLRVKYNYLDTPLFLLLDDNGHMLTRTEGAVDERQFFTYIGGPLEDSARRR
jgi:hypothetical protein